MASNVAAKKLCQNTNLNLFKTIPLYTSVNMTTQRETVLLTVKPGWFRLPNFSIISGSVKLSKILFWFVSRWSSWSSMRICGGSGISDLPRGRWRREDIRTHTRACVSEWWMWREMEEVEVKEEASCRQRTWPTGSNAIICYWWTQSYFCLYIRTHTRPCMYGLIIVAFVENWRAKSSSEFNNRDDDDKWRGIWSRITYEIAS